MIVKTFAPEDGAESFAIMVDWALRPLAAP
jgi:hypothetical protein